MRKLTLLGALVVVAVGLAWWWRPVEAPSPPVPAARFEPPSLIPDLQVLPPPEGRRPLPLVLPEEVPPDAPPDRVFAGRTLVRRARFEELAQAYGYPGPRASVREAWERGDADAQLSHARAKADRLAAIRSLHQMINLNRLQQALTEVHLVATFAGLTETEAAVGPLVDRLRGLEADGAVPVERVREEACALVTVEGPRVTPAMERAVTRLEGTAAALCEDPLGLLPEELATSANAFVIPRSEAEGWP